MVGKTLGHYEIREPLGAGGLGAPRQLAVVEAMAALMGNLSR